MKKSINIAIIPAYKPGMEMPETVRELKEAGFEVMDKIVVYAKDNDKLKGIMEANKADIIRDVMADGIEYDRTEGYEKAWDINGEKVTLGVKKIS